MTPEIRPIRDDELPAFLEALSTAFLERPDIDRVAAELRPIWDLGRVWAAFDGGRLCGTFRSWATELTVPGGARLPAAAIAAVTVMPSHRRRGILRGMAAREHAANLERGEAVGLLYASEYPIYGRFGYGPACRVATWTLDARATAFVGGPPDGIEVVRPSASVRDAARGVFEAWRLRQPGEIWRRDATWEYDLGLRESAWGPAWKGFVALRHGASGDVDGYVRYRAEEKWEQRQPRGVIRVDDLHALTDEAYQALWRYLADIDFASMVVAESRSPAERLPWLLTNARAAAVSDLGDGMWVRLVDVRRALETRTYESTGSLVLEVVDREVPGRPTRLLLDGGPEGATCQATGRSPDLTVALSALGAAYLGGVRLSDAVLATGADEHRPGALAEADRLLRTSDEPWCSTFF